MAFSVNKVTLLGNVARDVELRYTPNGTAVATFTLATNRSIKDENEQSGYRDIPSFHRVTVWSKLAEFASKQLYKGEKVYVEGRLDYRSYEKDGNTVYATDIVLDTIIPMAKAQNRQADVSDQDIADSGLADAPAPTPEPTQEPLPAEPTKPAKENVNVDDIPF